jgi:hypothetical protein
MVRKIATFGCWNNKKYVNSYIPVENVLKHLKENENKYNDLIVLGDNYYPEKIAKKAIYDHDNFNFGFNLLNSINIENKYIIMGNHDLQDFYNLSCCTMIKQKNMSELKYQFPFQKLDIIEDGIKFRYIFIDSNLYELTGKTCFNLMEGKSVEEIKCKQNKFIIDCLSDNTINYFLFFAHHPLIAVKTKNDTNEAKPTSILTFDKQRLSNGTKAIINHNELIKLLDKNIRTDNIFWICADVHMYQSSSIKMKNHTITQIISGSAGANKDKFNSDNKKFIVDDYEINIIDVDSSLNSFGYVELELDKTGIKYNYINVNKNLYGRKYLINYN